MHESYQSTRVLISIFWIGWIAAPTLCHAQVAAPSQLTPQSLRPDSGSRDQGIALSRQTTLTAPAGAEDLYVLIDDVTIDGAFSELASQTESIVRDIRGKRVTLSQIYAFAASIERVYAGAGYTLVRVVVPPQKLVDRGRLAVLVIDGFIEGIDVASLPDRVRAVVAERVSFLVGRRHVKLSDIERGLLIAGDIPGLKLRSALMRGSSNGGTRLVLEGEHRQVSASAGVDNRLMQSLGTWQLRGTIAVNSALGAGEQVYGTIGLGADLAAVTAGSSPLAVFGGGAVILVGTDGVTLNPEYTHSTTQTRQTPGVPASFGTFERFALRMRDPVIWTRNSSLNLNFSVEYLTQQVYAPDFGVTLNNDRYAAIRIGPDYATTLPWGTRLQLGTSLSQGLGGRTEADAVTSAIPLSRAGAGPDFTKITGSFRLLQPLPEETRLDLIALGQASMGKPMLRSEQFALDGADALSSFAAGTFSVDQGITLRGEFGRPFSARFDALGATVSPYVFGSVGRGWLFDVTSVEQSTINAGALGLGTRGSIEVANGSPGLNFGLELAKQFTDVPGMRQGWRGNVSATVAF